MKTTRNIVIKCLECKNIFGCYNYDRNPIKKKCIECKEKNCPSEGGETIETSIICQDCQHLFPDDMIIGLA